MESKLLKHSLREAKEAIKNRDIDSALKICKAILKEDRNNYYGLVLFGAALQESNQKDQAPNAYRKAIEVSPDHLLAWQGLASYYEKNYCYEHTSQLLPIYQRLLQLESESSKWCEVIFKIQEIISKFKCDDYIAEVVSSYKNVTDNNKLDALCKLTIHYLSYVDKIPEKHLQLYEDFLNNSIPGLESEHYQVYFKLLYNQKKTKEFLVFAEKILEKTYDHGVLEWICKVCSEEFVENRSFILDWCDRLPKYYTSLLEANKDNVAALLAQGTYYMSQRAYLEARESLKYCLSLDEENFHTLCLLAETYVHLLCPEQASQLIKSAHALRPNHIFLRALLVKILSFSKEQESLKKAVSLASKVLAEGHNDMAVEGLCLALLHLGEWVELSEAVAKLTHAPFLASLLQMEADTKANAGDLLLLLDNQTPNCPEAWYRLGELQIDSGSHSSACVSFLKCAKLAPYWYTTYLQLGHIYTRNNTTLDKARRCYQRALVLNPGSISTQMALSDIYSTLGDSKSNISLLEDICSQPEGKWAWPRLGLQYADLGNTSAAINWLRSALKSDPNNSHIWEALADAYLTRGANGSALKSYQKVLDLRPGAFYPALQIATIKQITDLPEESLLEFRELVEKQPNSILALKGLCETCIHLAKNFITQRLVGLARDRLQEGLEAIARSVKARPEIACLWKLAGDCLTITGGLPQSWCFLTIPEELLPDSPTLKGLPVLELGARCFCRCLKLMGDVNKAMVWHNLALNYRHQAKLCAIKHESRDRARVLSLKALAASKESVITDPRNWQHWNLLGIVSVLPELKKFALAQHAFIKATTADETEAVPWANLGVLYLILGDLKLANSSFSAAQRIDPEYCPSWTGQALVAEQVQNEETMDLFRHTTQLGYHAESCLGYAQWVCQTLQLTTVKNDPHYVYSIEKMHAVPAAVDALTWATDEEEENACGLNMLGCLLERCGLYRSSVAVLSRAVEHCSSLHKDKVLANFARVLLKADKIEDSIQAYKLISKANIHSQCGLALALYRGKLYQEAYDAYQAALDWWATNDSVKSQLFVALAAVAYRMAGPDNAKTLLLEGNQLQPPAVSGLFATCSLGMLNSDLELSKVALKDLLRYQNQSDYISHVAFFQAYIKIIQGDTQGSVWTMSKTVHRQPSQAALWLHLALLVLHKQSLKPDPNYNVAVAAQCAHTAMTLGHTYMDVSKVLAVVSLSHLMSGNVVGGLSASQHAVHLYPDVGESWAVLAASCYAAKVKTPLRPLISHARQHTDLERPLAKWMSNFERKIAILS